MIEDNRICPDCGGLIKVRNPTGKCDHLYYPEMKTPTKEVKYPKDMKNWMEGFDKGKKEALEDELKWLKDFLTKFSGRYKQFVDKRITEIKQKLEELK